MSGVFGGSSPPPPPVVYQPPPEPVYTPAPAPAPAPAPEPPAKPADPIVQKAATEQRQASARRRGLVGTILTGEQGLGGVAPTTARKTLLGS